MTLPDTGSVVNKVASRENSLDFHVCDVLHVVYTRAMRFEWDEIKNGLNQKNHDGIDLISLALFLQMKTSLSRWIGSKMGKSAGTLLEELVVS